MRYILQTAILAVIVFLAYVAPSQARSYLAPNTQYSQAQIQTMFENSGNSYLAQNASTFAAMSYKVESMGGNSAIYNGSCCTGLMQMNQGNLATFCDCTSAQYAAMSGQQQINIYAQYYESIANAGSVQTLLDMQANGESVGGYKVDSAMVAACIQLGVGNCQKSIDNGCVGVSSSAGGDGSVNICTMAAKAGGTTGGGGSNAGGQMACLVPLMKDNGVQLMSPYGADRSNRPGASKGMHQGLDIVNGFTGGNVENNPIYAGHGGKTTFRLNGAGGNWVSVRAENDKYNTVYYHLAHKDLDTFRQQNPTVAAGDTIGYMGNTGTSGEGHGTGGTHLHLGMTVRGSVLQSAGAGGRVMATGACPTCGSKSRPPLSASEISSAANDSWYFVNPEPFLDKQIPVPAALQSGYPGYFSERADPSKTLPTTCSLDPAIATSQPMSTGSGTSVSNAEAGLGSYRNEGEDFASSQASGDTRSIYLDLARVALDEAQAASLGMSAQNQLASAVAHMIVNEQRTSR
ncbi:M23 family metallopeptidase (plasmid) [Agrobacterium rosae]|uniref:M23 family metallopeptidase n=1 Tax=Agrobacterium rosae TaxID=1972867 RepID=A0AAW9FKS5_9HYPH|nr:MULTISPECIES: M23 family metallopeptidase [Agrobacterium]MDX8321694.1 M23 family metallopeptidase [Agrobacterium sp. rho-8.1]MDX8305157.1 M23 family metallopeptidase [Agrobacterium rosae]MDX8311441.1 M23 family metallopeptidase [Agrobacterium sp. rho-13.3]MDX8316327.1 M23 family metallopeptidase [Agrobacterium rosae]MDX8332366.1 M23 family metallopeptidase [Agrobacterium rosae]